MPSKYVYEVSICAIYPKEHRFETLATKVIVRDKPVTYKEVEYQKYDKANPPEKIYVKYIEQINKDLFN